MGTKEDFISLFIGQEKTIRNLPERFPIKDFSYMYTSQRTMARIKEKLNQIQAGRAKGNLHGNFWIDLRNMGLAKIAPNEISEFGIVVSDYFEKEDDEFKREYFVLSGIRQKVFDISDQIYAIYINKVKEFNDFISRIPILNYPGKEIINNQEKLLISGFLNTFPFALSRYYALPEHKQAEIDNLHESGLKNIFPSRESHSIYYKIAKRLWNVWRAPQRRVNFIKSVILFEYEEKLELAKDEKIPFIIFSRFSKILNKNILKEIIENSDNIKITEENGKSFIEHRSLKLQSLPYKRLVKRTYEINSKAIYRKRITSSKQLQLSSVQKITKPSIDPSELLLWNEMRREKTREHQNIVIKFWEFYYQHGIPADQNNFDLLVEKGNKVLLHEIKTLSDYNERTQIIKAIGQLFYYEYLELPILLKNDNSEIIKIAVFQRKLKNNLHIDYMKSLGIYVYWITDTGDISGEEESIKFLKNFVIS